MNMKTLIILVVALSSAWAADTIFPVERIPHPINGQYTITGASAVIDKGWPLDIFKIRDGTSIHAPGQDSVLAVSVAPIPGQIPYCMNGKVVIIDDNNYDLYLTWAGIDTFTTAFKTAQMVFRIHGDGPYDGYILQTLNYTNPSEEHQDQLKRKVQLHRWKAAQLAP